VAPPLLTLSGIALTFGGRPLFAGAEIAVGKGDRVGLVGRNGSGKSTLLKIAGGLVQPDDGERWVQPGTRIAYLPQEPDLSGFATVADYVAAGLPSHDETDRYKVDAVLDGVGLDGGRAPQGLSGGEARRAAIARALVGEPDILLLDEPTNHLDLPAIEWLEETLAGFNGGFVLISHDRALLTRLTRVTFWLDRGVVRRLEKGFRDFEAWSEDILAREAVEQAKLDKLIEKETEWSHQGISARRKRNQGRLRRLGDLRQERAQQIARTGSVKLEAEAGQSSGRLVMEAERVAKSFGERTIVKGFSTRILRGDRVGIIGPNGAGKTTLLKMLTGQLEPDSGSVKLGTNLQMAVFDQHRAQLDPEASIWDTLADSGGDQVMVRGKPRHVVSYLRDFLFDDRQARSPVKALSGGERNRLLLAKVLARPANLLILDEPTNDLDIETLDLLEEMLADYDGTLLLVSHDRDFLDRIVTSTIVLEGDGSAAEYAGGYTDYLKQRPERGPAATAAAKKAERPADGGGGRSTAKLSFKQQRALEELPKTMAKLEAEIAKLESAMADPNLYAKDPARFQASAERIGKAREELAAAEEQWLELEMLREEMARR